MADFLLTLADSATTIRVYNDGRALSAAAFRAHLWPWSRQAGAIGGGALPSLVDIILTGIPDHAWS